MSDGILALILVVALVAVLATVMPRLGVKTEQKRRRRRH